MSPESVRAEIWHDAVPETSAERVVVVSLQKAGTHLIEAILRGMGYQSVGAAVRVPAERAVQFDRETRLAIAEQALSSARYRAVRAMRTDEAFVRATDEAWSLLAWGWQRRMGFPIRRRYGEALDTRVAAFVDRSGHLYFRDTPPRLAWYLHELDLEFCDAGFLREWLAGDVRIIFNHRDIRDVITSFLNYLLRDGIERIGDFTDYRLYRDILGALPSTDVRLSHALIDNSFPGYDAHERALWLLNHPAACHVSFEELVGSRGGGDDRQQEQALHAIADHLSLTLNAAEVKRLAGLSGDPASFTFHRGQIGAWREFFKPKHLDRYYARYGDIARLYGYL